MQRHTIFFWPPTVHVHLRYGVPHSPQISNSVRAYLPQYWMYPKKVDKCVRIRDKKKQKGKTHMPNKNSPTKYSEEFKKTIVTLYQSGKTYAEIKKEYGVSSSALSNWVRKYSQVQVDEDTVLTAQQIKALQRRNAELEEENLILKKAIAIFTPHSDRD